MPELEEIEKEIIDNLPKDIPQDKMKFIHEELEKLSVTDGLEGKNNLQAFYDIWQKRKNQKGKLNQINSWTAYYLGLTSKEPNGEFLVPRRAFARAGFPDIDTDFCSLRRDEVITYLKNKYGDDKVSNLGTYSALSFRSCLTRLIKALDIAGAFHKGKDAFKTENNLKVREIIDKIPPPISGKVRGKDNNGNDIEVKTIQDAYNCFKDFRFYIDRYPQLLENGKNIEGLLATTGIHASGIIVSDIALEKIAPLKVSRKNVATQFANEDLEKLGLIKFDILGIKTLSIIQECLNLVKQNYGIELDLQNFDLEDQETFKLYASGKLTGVFQCENYGMQKTMVDIQVSRFEDIMAAISLFRPGPMQNIPDYCLRKFGKQRIDYFHPAIEKFVKPYLERTYGIMCYQEQVMQVCNSLGGLSVTDGYILIKGIGKKKIHLIEKYKKQFVNGAKNNGLDEKIAIDYWDKYIIPFASYGFNLAHACAYSLLSYWCCFLKSHYPEEFFCSLINIEIKEKGQDWFDKIKIFEADAEKHFNIKILPRKINTCDVFYKIVKKKNVSLGVMQSEIMPGLAAKSTGVESATEIAKHQPYRDLKDLAEKTDSRLVDIEVMTSLFECGFFDEYVKMYKEKTKKTLTQEAFVAKFVNIRNDLKTAARKGVVSTDLLAGE